jgi:hypothetical protein
MSRQSALRARRRTLCGLAAAVSLLAVAPGVGVAQASSRADDHSHGSCPAPESLVPKTHWAHHALAKGVTMASGTAHDSNGVVNMHVLRVDLTRPRVSVQPLVHSLGERLALSTLAAHHSRLVAATNTGYFDFIYGAPTDPLIIGGVPQVISTRHQAVVGIGKNGRVEAGLVWTTSSVTIAGSAHPLVAENETSPPAGVGVYNARWGSGRVPGNWSATSRPVVNGSLGATGSRHNVSVPAGGYLLQARGRSASNWLNGLSSGSKVSLSSSIKSTASSPFVQAYGVGVQLVAKPGVTRTGFSCDSANTTQPARTAIGWTRGGRTMVIAVVADHPGTSLHGLDEDQMSKLMVQLGVNQAYSFDGSGSSELLAKLRSSSSLRRQTYPADGAERPMPVGLGISVAPAKHRSHHKH